VADFVIPKGREFEFTIRVIEADSFLPQNLSQAVGATLTLVKKSNPEVTVLSTVLTVTDAVNGILTGTIPATTVGDAVGTADLDYLRGKAEDDYYLKPVYTGIVEVDPVTVPKIITIIEDIYVTPTGD